MYRSLEAACINAVEDGLLHGIVVAAGRSTSVDFLWACWQCGPLLNG